MNSITSILSWFFVCLGLLFLFYGLFICDLSTAGDFVSGFAGSLFSLVGVLLLFETLREQRLESHRHDVENRLNSLKELCITKQDVFQRIADGIGLMDNPKTDVDTLNYMLIEFDRLINDSSLSGSLKESVYLSYFSFFFWNAEKAYDTLEKNESTKGSYTLYQKKFKDLCVKIYYFLIEDEIVARNDEFERKNPKKSYPPIPNPFQFLGIGQVFVGIHCLFVGY